MTMVGVLDLGVDLDVWPWVWLGVAVVFAMIELTILAGSFVLLPFAVSAFIASIIAFYDAPIEAQWLTFLIGGALLFGVMYRWSRRFLNDNAKPLGVGADRLVGMTGVVTVSVPSDSSDRRGRVSVDGEVWGAVTDAGTSLATGARVRVVAMRGTRVVVESVTLEGDREEKP